VSSELALHRRNIMSNCLSSLNDNELLGRLLDLRRRERDTTLEILMHLNEVERRKLHLAHGYSSMFVYCTSGLGYSEPAAFRRISTARCIARFPEIYALLEANEVNLSTIASVSRVLTAANKDTLLSRIRGRSRREAEAIVAEYEPQAKRRETVRPVVVRVPVTLGSLELSSRADANPAASAGQRTDDTAVKKDATSPWAGRAGSFVEQPCEKDDYFRREGNSDPTTSTEKRVQFQFTTTEAFQRKVEKVRALAWHRLPANASLEQVFELVLEEFIEKHDPRARRERREKRTQAKVHCNLGTPKLTATPRHVTAVIKDDVHVRDNAQCTFVGAGGRRCGATHGLQIDHVTPRACYGTNDASNLRLLCARHNRLEAERILGSPLMDRYQRPRDSM
jgi:hypothetical protein